ncbi:MAG: type II toxin-antitoxin system Phd/YefM family antitoxin [Cyanosarcina radialis HA8281-LM2]|jgi:prevent-host-death family protein|nr:type II toxin-antitoxin system Phd/YefM family antitoxin [Cyanosarcina radialis HA8281-LM2]
MSQIKIDEIPENLQKLFTEVERTQTPLTVTREGKPLVIISPAKTQSKRAAFGAMKGRGEILGDLITPPVPLSTWDVLS